MQINDSSNVMVLVARNAASKCMRGLGGSLEVRRLCHGGFQFSFAAFCDGRSHTDVSAESTIDSIDTNIFAPTSEKQYNM